MKIMEITDELICFERKLRFSVDLLEITKGFCELNYDKAPEVSSILTALELLLNEQRDLSSRFDVILSKVEDLR